VTAAEVEALFDLHIGYLIDGIARDAECGVAARRPARR
jgi:hypothetical protein